MNLFVQETGTRGAPSIVFLHVVGTSGWMWWNQTAALSDYHCLNVDLPGHGKSNGVKWVSMADAADQVAGVIREKATNGRAHLVGLSLGGYIGLFLLARHPDVVDRAVISGVSPESTMNRRLLGGQVFLMSLLQKSGWFIAQQVGPGKFPPEQKAALIDNFRAMSMKTYRQIMEEAIDFRLPPGVRDANAPTLIVAGSTEPKDILEGVHTIAQTMPNGTGRLATGYGHGWNMEAPDLFSAMVRAWITGAALPSGLAA